MAGYTVEITIKTLRHGAAAAAQVIMKDLTGLDSIEASAVVSALADGAESWKQYFADRDAGAQRS